MTRHTDQEPRYPSSYAPGSWSGDDFGFLREHQPDPETCGVTVLAQGFPPRFLAHCRKHGRLTEGHLPTNAAAKAVADEHALH